MDLLHFAWASYCNDSALAAWDCHWCDRVANVQLVTVLENEEYGTRGYVAVDAAHDRVILSIRGSVNDQNKVEDAMFWKRHFSAAPVGVEVHSGFLSAYQAIRKDILDAIAAGLNECLGCSVVSTGHSLGAAMATLAAAELAAPPMPEGTVHLFTFGSPRVGNAAFASWAVERLGSNTARMTREDDIVPSIPPEFLAYRHLPTEIWNRHKQGADDWYLVCDGSGEDPHCHDSELPTSPGEHVQYMGFKGGGCPHGPRSSVAAVAVAAQASEQNTVLVV